MYWLAINREPVFFEELQENFVTKKSQSDLLKVILSLHRRSLIEKISMQYTQQPVIMEYVRERFFDLCCGEIIKEKTIFLKSHTLIKATAQDYVKESQIRLILEPLVTQIHAIL